MCLTRVIERAGDQQDTLTEDEITRLEERAVQG